MKILHIASFRGNIGDILNQRGFYRLFDDLFSGSMIDRIELREFYYSSNKHRKFDGDFAKIVNGYDLCVLGGGGFFDVQWDESNTGTTLDFSDDFIDTVTTSIWINAMGYHEYPDRTTDENLQRFKRFIDRIKEKNNWFVSIRNDGSYNRLCRRFGKDFCDFLHVVPDNGFSYDMERVNNKPDSNSQYIGICITNDLFTEEYNHSLTTDDLNELIAQLIERFIAEGNTIIFFLHAPQDIHTVAAICDLISADSKRNHVMIAPYDVVTEESVETYLSWYVKCNYIIAMRFHSCIMGLLAGTRTIALAGHEQIEGLYRELGLETFLAVADDTTIGDRIYDILVGFDENRYLALTETNLSKIRLEAEEYHRIIGDFLDYEKRSSNR